jgi:hypothetical protein
MAGYEYVSPRYLDNGYGVVMVQLVKKHITMLLHTNNTAWLIYTKDTTMS